MLLVFFRPHRSRNLRQAAQQRRDLQPQFVIDGRRAANNCSGLDVASNTTLRRNNGPIADLAMTNNADLPCKDYIVTDLGRTREADLRSEQGMLSDVRAVADLNQVIDFRAFGNTGFANA